MRCLYCHNPDTWSASPANLMSAQELLDKAERYRSYWGNEGGITVSGGEPLLQIDFLLSLFEVAKKRGISTCLDTSAQPFSRNEPFFSKFTKLMELTDTVLLDLKHSDSMAHRKLTGVSNENIIDCAHLLSDLGVSVWIRHVLVPGITDDEAQLLKLREIIDTLHNVQKVEVLPYHSMAKFKYQNLGIPFPLPDTQSPTKESVEKAKKILGAV